MSHGPRSLARVEAGAGRHPVSAQARELRREAESRLTEVHLLVAALQEHIADLRLERDRLAAENANLREQVRLRDTAWMLRGVKQNR
jgi:hypothetical protein